MNPQTLAAFIAVAREGSLTRAAQHLHMTQPAVGLHIKNLHLQTGLRLLSRTAQGMRLTADGAALLPLAQKALQAQADFMAAAARMQQEIRGHLRIGTILDPGFIRLGALLKELLAQAPYLEIALAHGMSGEVLQRVLREELDAGFYLSVPGDTAAAAQVTTYLLTRFTYRVLAPAGWETRVMGQPWEALAQLPWLATPAASAHHRLQSLIFGPGSLTGVSANHVALVDQEASMLDLVKSGVGLSLVRDHIALREAQSHGLVIADRVSLDCALSFVCLSTRLETPAVAAALAALQRAWPQAQPAA